MGDLDIRVTPRRGEVRGLILRAALGLFTSRGYFNTSVHDIQAEAAVSIGSIYNHFGGKEGIARALYGDLQQCMRTLVDTAIESHRDTCSRGLALVSSLFELTEADPETIRFMLTASHREFLPDEPPICSSEPFVLMRDVLRQGTQHGELLDLDIMVAASCAYGPALRMINMRLDGVASSPLPPLADEVWQAAWRSMRHETN